MTSQPSPIEIAKAGSQTAIGLTREQWEGNNRRTNTYGVGISYETALASQTQIGIGTNFRYTKEEFSTIQANIEQTPQVLSAQKWCADANFALQHKKIAFLAQYGISFENGQIAQQNIRFRTDYDGKKVDLYLLGDAQFPADMDKKYIVETGASFTAKNKIQGLVAIGYDTQKGFYPKIGIRSTF